MIGKKWSLRRQVRNWEPRGKLKTKLYEFEQLFNKNSFYVKSWKAYIMSDRWIEDCGICESTTVYSWLERRVTCCFVWPFNQENLCQLSAISVFICCFVICIALDKDISSKYWTVTVFLKIFLCGHLIASFAISSHLHSFASFFPLVKLCYSSPSLL